MAGNLRVSCVAILPARESIFMKISSVPVLPVAGTVLLSMFGATHTASGNDELWSELEGGGKVVLMRHAPVERGADRGNPLLRDPSCKGERNLSSQGQSDAAEVGRRFREHGVPVEEVLHSPFCRTTETAKRAFGTATAVEYLSLLEILSAEEAAQQTERLNRTIGSYAGEGNLILVTHEPNINSVSFETIRHLDFVVLDPAGEAEFEELGVIRFTGSE
jgi:phosphohistidine phosphatase SixA